MLRAPEEARARPAPAYVIPLSTGVTFALTEKAPIDKIPLISMGYGRSESRDGSVFQWNFPLLGTYWTAADIILQHIAKKEGGFDKLKGKKIALVYHDSPYGKEPIALLQKRGADARLRDDAPAGDPSGRRAEGDLAADPPEPPRLCAALGLGRDELDRHQGGGRGRLSAREDVRRVVVGRRAGCASGRGRRQGLQFGRRCSTRPVSSSCTRTSRSTSTTRARAGAKWEETGEILYIRGLINAMLGVEAIRTAQEKFGNKPLTGEQVRWGLENLDLTADRLKQLGFEGVLQPVKVSCADHEGARTGRIQTWDGKNWKITSDWYTSDDSVIAPMVKEAAAKIRGREEDHAGLPGHQLMAVPVEQARDAQGAAVAAAFRYGAGETASRRPLPCANPRGQQYRSGLRSRHPGAQGRVARGAAGRDRGAARRQRRRQVDHAQGDLQPAFGRARRGHQGLDRLRRRARCMRSPPTSWCGAAASR